MKRNLEHNSHKRTGMPLTEIQSSVDYLWPLYTATPTPCNLFVEIVNGQLYAYIIQSYTTSNPMPGDDESDDECSTGAAVAISIVVTFIITLKLVTALIIFIIISMYYKQLSV